MRRALVHAQKKIKFFVILRIAVEQMTAAELH